VLVYVDQLFNVPKNQCGAAAMDELLLQKPILKEDYYAVLGCDELSTVR